LAGADLSAIVGFTARPVKRHARRLHHTGVSVFRIVVLSAAEVIVEAILDIQDRDRVDDQTM